MAAEFSKLPDMMTLRKSPGNQQKLDRLKMLLGQLLAESLQHGFHGIVAVEIQVQDGTIQSIRRKVEQIER
jgi:hypothetical protein